MLGRGQDIIALESGATGTKHKGKEDEVLHHDYH